MPLLDPEFVKLIEACRTNAEDFYRAATIMRREGHRNIAYHLATLALEELGKAQLLGIKSVSRDEDSSWHEKQIDDHVKKLFWALWGPSIHKRRPDKDEIETLRGLAAKIHENRLQGLYVSTVASEFVMPAEAIPEESVSILMDLVESRLAMEPHFNGDAEPEPEDVAVLQWLSGVTDDTERRGFIFSSASFDKLEEFGNLLEWARWLKAEVERTERDAIAKLNQELQRKEPEKAEALEEKWQIKIRLFSQSHSLRPKILTEWNKHVTWIKLHLANKKKGEFIAEFRLPKYVPIQGLWYVALGFANTLVAALNIGTGGLFWWYIPQHTGQFAESIVDLESQMSAGIRRTPELKIAWPNAALDLHLLNRIIFCFTMMPKPDERDKHEPFNHYLTGMALMAKTDVFLQFEVQSYGAFLSALDTGTVVYGKRTAADNFEDSLAIALKEIIGSEEFINKHVSLAKAYKSRSLAQGQITLSEVAEMKLICDAFFFHMFNLAAEKRRMQPGAEDEGSGPDATL
jgi:AbiV family abortive infection protein